MTRPLAYFDMEIFSNYCLVAFMREDGTRRRWVATTPDAKFPGPEIVRFVKEHTLVSFNGIGFDIPLLMLVIRKEPVRVIKQAANRIIVDGLKWWNFEKEYHVKCQRPEIDHIDLMEVAPLTGSLKLYAAKCHSWSIQDLPVDPMKDLTPEQMEEIEAYCFNDLLSTRDLYHALRPQIEMRTAMSTTYGIDLRSKSDAQMAEAIITSEVEKIKKHKIERPPDLGGQTFRYQPPAWMELWEIDILDAILEAQFLVSDKGRVILPEALKERKIVYKGREYRMGIGGLHSSETKQIVRSDEQTLLMDFDVASYYPSIVLNEKLYPFHLGVEFLTVYRGLVEKRLAAKKRAAELKKVSPVPQDLVAVMVEMEGLKVSINGTFGKLGSRYSVLYSPNLLIQVTVTGQLALLMLIEAVGAIAGADVVSANTDGIMVSCVKSKESFVLDAVKRWEQITGYVTERVDYEAIFSRDVNNYVAFKLDGEVKSKGAYGKGLPLHKNPSADICAEAAIAYLKDGRSLEETIHGCHDMRKFVKVQRVTGGAVYQGQPIGKVVRWYYSSTSVDAIYYALNKRLVAQTEGAKPLIELPFELPDDLNFNWYIQEAKSMIWDLGLDVNGEWAPVKAKKTRKKQEVACV